MIVILGAGYAGAATAWALARRGAAQDVTLLEAEPSAGLHASGRNAGLIGTLLEKDDALMEMAARGARRLREPIGSGPAPFIECGSVRLVDEGPALDAIVERAERFDVRIETLRTEQLARQVPLLAGAGSPVALRCATDGKVDPAGLVDRYLAAALEAGTRLVTGARVTDFIHRGGRPVGVVTTAGVFEGRWFVDAAGAWAPQVAGLAGLTSPELASYRRHLYGTAPIPGIDPTWPWAWDLVRDVYYRVDGDRLTLCACDAEPHPPAPPLVSDAVAENLRDKLAMGFPAVAGAPLEWARACLRTFASDGLYVVGPDPRMEGFFWVAGLGGTGAAAGAAVGELAADLLLGDGSAPGWPDHLVRRFDPARLIPSRSKEVDR